MEILDRARQGDILFFKTKKSSFRKQFNPQTKETLTVALGEVSGHHHTMFGIGNAEVTHLVDEETEGKEGVTPNDVVAMFFEVTNGDAVVTHQEHNPVTLNETAEDELWVRVIQVEHDPFENQIRRVMD